MRQLQKRSRTSIDILESRRLMSVSLTSGITVDPPVSTVAAEPITIGTPALHDITFKAANGRSTLIYASGVTATVYFAGNDVPTLYHHHAIFPAGTVETIDSIALTNATPGKAMFGFTRLSFGVGTFSVGSITGGDVNTINAPDTILTGSLVTTSLHHLSLYGVSGAAMSLGNFPTAIKIGADLTGSLTALTLGTLTAQSLFQANISTTGIYSRSKNQISSITIAKGIEESSIISAGNIGTISAGYIEKSVISAGANLPATAAYPSAGLPESASAFTAAAVIHSVKVSTKKVGSYQQGFFSDSVIAAYTVGAIQLSQLNATGGGIASHSYGSFATVSPNGNLDKIKISLGHSQLSTITKLQSALTHLGVAFTTGAVPTVDTVIYDFAIEILG